MTVSYSARWPLLLALLWMMTIMTQQAFPETQPSDPSQETQNTVSNAASLTDSLSALFDELDIPHTKTFDAMVDASQRWRRRSGQERWEMPDIKLNQQQQLRVLAHLAKLGLINELHPISQQFEYALLLGATVPRMEHRLNQLIKLWKEGVRFNQIIVLAGQRPLAADIDQVEALINRIIGEDTQGEARTIARPLTETEAARLLFKVTNMPADMGQVPVVFIDTPKLWQQDHWQRPCTRDTLKKWIGTSTPETGAPKSGKTLIVSDQPHALYQQEVVRQELPDSFTTEVTAQQAGADTRVAIYLDALALWLHNLQPHNLQHQTSSDHRY